MDTVKSVVAYIIGHAYKSEMVVALPINACLVWIEPFKNRDYVNSKNSYIQIRIHRQYTVQTSHTCYRDTQESFSYIYQDYTYAGLYLRDVVEVTTNTVNFYRLDAKGFTTARKLTFNCQN